MRDAKRNRQIYGQIILFYFQIDFIWQMGAERQRERDLGDLFAFIAQDICL